MSLLIGLVVSTAFHWMGSISNSNHKICSKDKKYQRRGDSNPGLLGGKQESFLFATQSPLKLLFGHYALAYLLKDPHCSKTFFLFLEIKIGPRTDPSDWSEETGQFFFGTRQYEN